MDPREAVEELTTIRRIMESASQLTVMPAAAAIAGGLLALGGCAGTYLVLRSLDLGRMAEVTAARRLELIGLWAVLAALAVVIDIAVTTRLATRHGASPWTRLGQLGAYIMLPALAAGLVLTLALGRLGQWQLVPAVWMLLYGCALWTTSILSLRAPSALGLGFFIAGVLTVLWPGPLGLIMVALTFGMGHILFGVYLLVRFGE